MEKFDIPRGTAKSHLIHSLANIVNAEPPAARSYKNDNEKTYLNELYFLEDSLLNVVDDAVYGVRFTAGLNIVFLPQ